MPYARPTLSELRTQVAQDIAAGLDGADALLRFSNLRITGAAQANLANLHYGYLDWISKQAVPFTAAEEFLVGWAALKGITQKQPTSATGQITFTGTPGVTIPDQTSIVRGDGVIFTTLGAVTIGGGGTGTVMAVADPDPSGEKGEFGNTDVGTLMTLAQAIAGINSTGTVTSAFIGGTDLESDDDFRSRMLDVYASPPQGGASADYKKWAKEVAGVTRAWCTPNGFGLGTVVVYVMLDNANSAFGGFPQGSNGVAASETRGVVATGDQLTIANHIFAVQPANALVYVVSPLANPVDFTIHGIPAGLQATVTAAVADVFVREGSPGGTVPLIHIWSAIAGLTGGTSFSVVSPNSDIASSTGHIPTVGTITYT